VNLRRRIGALAVVGVLGLAACGSGEPAAAPLPTAAPVATGDTGGSQSTVANGGGPDATISPDVPADYLPAIGPVEVIGEPLPPLETKDIASDPAIGLPAPVLVGVGYDGATVRIDAAADGPTMVVFLAHWCPHCNAEVPRLNQLRDQGRFPADLNIVAVATASDPSRPNFPPGPWLAGIDWTYPAMADGIDVQAGYIAAAAYGVSGFPFVALVDGDGNVVARWSGESTPDEVVDRIATYLALS
jgi:thiol-disulfide isomerase/thioredoxin